jgi:DNA polymerase-3 subunit beta
MKITILQENLKKGLFMVGHIAGKNINLPILNNILITAAEGDIKLVTTNLEIAIISTIRGKVDVDGTYTVDSKIFNDYVGLLPNQKTTIETKENNLIIECENYKTKIRGLSSEEYPLIPEVERKSFCEIEVDVFLRALNQVLPAVSVGETRVELSGVYFNIGGEEMVIAATDSYRLAEKKLKLKTNNSCEKNFIVPTKTLQELSRVLSNTKDEGTEVSSTGMVRFYVSENQILFIVNQTEIISRLIEGQFPEYGQIIPTNIKTNAIIDKQELVRAVKAAALFSKAGINDINLDFPSGKKNIIISSASGQAGENITELEASVAGEDNAAVINYRYLLDGLSAIDDNKIRIEIVDGNTPCILKSEKDKNFIYIIMPIKQ